MSNKETEACGRLAQTDGSADAARLDKLEAYLSTPINNISAPFMGDGIWQFGHNGGDAYIIDGEGMSLREAIDSLPNEQICQPKECRQSAND